MKKRIPFVISLCTCICLFALSSCKTPEKENTSATPATSSSGISKASVDLKTSMRKLWEDHVTWTRNVICCLVDNLPGADQAVARLMKNQDDIGDAIKPIYGDDAGKKLTDLLHSHIAISADVVNAAKKNDKAGLDAANKKWYDNADSISAFLAAANPNWKLDDMKMMMHDHLKLTTDEAVARIKKDYAGDVKAYDKVVEEILKMSDGLADGIVAQYPDKFK
ncbi:MAG: glycosyltransferase [Bacteroidota bacterium]|nr:glycosyltransferase [Bacteroidota bacterium]MDP4237792.1 glycosyltransferase [Bacteroidota bacterium]